MVAGAIEPEFRGARRRLVETLQDKGIKDLALLRAVDTIPRHLFVPPTVRHRAYEDSALPIGNGQTISQPWVHARSVEQLLLTGTERVLEIGTGSGYQTALLSELAAQVFSVERYRELRPDLVTMDIVMPDMGGIDAVREITKHDPTAKILMCSAMGQQALVVEAIQAGAKDFVVKPFQPSRVLEAVNRVLAA